MKIDQLGFTRDEKGCYVFHDIGVFHSPINTTIELDDRKLWDNKTLFTELPTSKEIMARLKKINPTNPTKFCRRDLCYLTSRKVLNTTKGTIDLGTYPLQFVDWTWDEDVKPYLQEGSQFEEKWLSWNNHAKWTVREGA
tara:strand:+ start:777 stop:1193 length:417 start_codon:yes stop_codon:yes gene_type:complete